MAQPDSSAPLRKSWQVSRLIEIGLATTIGANISPCRDAPSFKSCSSKVWKWRCRDRAAERGCGVCALRGRGAGRNGPCTSRRSWSCCAA